MVRLLFIIPLMLSCCATTKGVRSFDNNDLVIDGKTNGITNSLEMFVVDNESFRGQSDPVNEDRNKSYLENPYGTFLHMQFINPANYEHIVEALVLSKVKVVNLNIYSYVFDLDKEAELVSLLNKAGIDVLFRYLWIPRYKSMANIHSNSCVDFEQWEKYLIKALKEFDGKEGRPYVKYISFMDEPQLYYSHNGKKVYDAFDFVEVYKIGYDIVKQERPDVIVASTTICEYHESFFNDLFSATLQDGTKYYNCVDILYFDYYANRNTALFPMIKKMTNSIMELQPEMFEKPMWYCCGTTSYNRMPEARAETLVKYILTAFYAGAETFNVYAFMMGGGCSQKFGNADYYGIIGPSVNNSYMSLLRGSYPERSLGEGDAFKRVYLGCPETYRQTTFDYCYFQLNEDMVKQVKKEGVIISGKNYSFTSIVINDGSVDDNGDPVTVKTLFKGRHRIGNNGEDSFFISADDLSDINVFDKIVIYYDRSDADVSNTWDVLDKYKTFDSFVTLQSFLPPGSSKPQITDVGDLHIVYWTYDNKPVYCIYRDDFVQPQTFSFSYDGSPELFDLYSNALSENLDYIEIGSSPIYIKGVSKLIVNK